MKLFNVRLPEFVLHCLTNDAEQQQRSVSYIVREILESHYNADVDRIAESSGEKSIVQKPSGMSPADRAAFFRDIKKAT